jgi:hypothetical protein
MTELPPAEIELLEEFREDLAPLKLMINLKEITNGITYLFKYF